MAVREEDLIDYNLFWEEKGFMLTLGDWILVLLSFTLFLGFPFLNWFYRGKRPDLTEIKNQAKKGVSMSKNAMDEGMA